MATQLTTYESTATNKRDVNDFVVNISPSDSPMYSMIAETGMTSRKKKMFMILMVGVAPLTLLLKVILSRIKRSQREAFLKTTLRFSIRLLIFPILKRKLLNTEE